MTAIAHFIAITCYIGAAALAATPFARPVGAPLKGEIRLLAAGVLAHAGALFSFSEQVRQLPLTGLGPSLSFAGFVLAVTLLIVEIVARDVSLALLVTPLAAIATVLAIFIGLVQISIVGNRRFLPPMRSSGKKSKHSGSGALASLPFPC